MGAAQNAQEFSSLCKERNSEFIRSIEDWTKARAEKRGVLAEINSAALDEFETHLLFKGGGVAHGNYERILEENGEHIVDQVLELFGIGEGYRAAIKNTYCQSKGTCASRHGSWCTDNC